MTDASSAIEYAKKNNFQVIIHLGISSLAKKITLEKCAYNENNFSCPDESGEQPQQCKIDPQDADIAYTSIDEDKVGVELQKRGYDIEISLDPGRFVCNYLYYCSLRARTAPATLFVHVPPFTVLNQERQEATLKTLREIICRSADQLRLDICPLTAALSDLGIERDKIQAVIQAGCANVDTAMEFLFSSDQDDTPIAATLENNISRPLPTQNTIDDVKLLVVVRTDLFMSQGKIAAQVSHACLGAYRLALEADPAMAFTWIDAFGEKIVVCAAPTYDEGSKESQLHFLQSTRRAASNAGVVTYIVHDAGRTEVEPGSITVLALGPAYSSRIDQYTRHLKLL